MAGIRSQSLRLADTWDAASPRAAGLYGELQVLPLPVKAPTPAARSAKPRRRPALID